MRLTVSHDFLPKLPSTRAAAIMDHFGIDFETGRHVVADGLELPVETGDVVYFTGASGSGKSSVMRAAAERLERSDGGGIGNLESGGSDGVMECWGETETDPYDGRPRPSTGSATSDGQGCPSYGDAGRVVHADSLELGDRILVDSLDGPVDESVRLLSSCGLGEAQLMLRTPAELSDGQRYRFRLAKALSLEPRWIVADEFTATLDRTLAKVVAYNIRRTASRTGVGFLLAGTHEDVSDDLQPDLLVRCRLDGRIEWERRDVKKKRSASRGTCGSAKAPEATGRTSLGGITAATTWESSAA